MYQDNMEMKDLLLKTHEDAIQKVTKSVKEQFTGLEKRLEEMSNKNQRAVLPVTVEDIEDKQWLMELRNTLNSYKGLCEGFGGKVRQHRVGRCRCNCERLEKNQNRYHCNAWEI